MQAVLDLLTLLVFACVMFAFYGLLSLSKRRQRAADSAARLEQLLRDKVPVNAPNSQAESIMREMQSAPLGNVPVVGVHVARIWVNLNLLGWRKTLKARAIMFGLGGFFAGVVIGRDTPMPWLFGSLIAVFAAVALFTLLYRQALGKYYKQLRQSLPEAIDSITRTCRAGVPISNAFALVAEHLSGPLSVEFAIIDHWLRLGVPLRRVMQDSTQRVPLAEYRFFAVILIINQEAGGRLGETLDRLSATLRDRHELQLKILSKTSEARASSKIVSSLVPAMLGYMYINAPQDFRFLLNDPTGNMVLFYAIASVTLGLVINHLMVSRVG
ncbi:hypothetical protein ALQ04_01866 [Pseudomonas cichorii]|uniref:Type II secretion system protein GspF domain-containing protein n=1 Tax=Pseudomonas cichorii TaxID=36746 RepID=A0A3M4MAT7_PSECI|nr:type II secretion system F family protein [Pseudomonas cichorii]RMQ50920.1 hypothetical protein ALQ04_01866 [Pseudomonas cichorii]